MNKGFVPKVTIVKRSAPDGEKWLYYDSDEKARKRSFFMEVLHMKCPRCAHDMRRKKTANKRYVFECPNCHLRIGAPEGPEKQKEEKDLDESI